MSMKIDHSQLSTYQQCPEKYCLSYEKQLTRADDQVNMPMLGGKAIHAGIASHAKKQSVPDAIKAVLGQPQAGERLYTLPNLIKAVREYADYMSLNFPGAEMLQTEKLHEMDLGDGITFEVKKDAVMRWNGGVYPVEIKTTARSAGLDQTFWKRWEYDEQVAAQIASCIKEYEECAGLILVGIRLAYRQRAYRGEPAGFHVEVSHQEYNRTSEQLVDWMVNVRGWVKKLAEDKRSATWGRHKSLCGWCDFDDLCKTCGDGEVMRTLYKQHDAYKYLKE